MYLGYLSHVSISNANVKFDLLYEKKMRRTLHYLEIYFFIFQQFYYYK